MDLSLTTETFQQDDQRWLASKHGADTAQPVTLSVSHFTVTNGYIPSGVVLAAYADGSYGPYVTAAGDSSATAVGILLEAVKVKSGATKVVGAMVKHCFIDTTHMPVASGNGAWDTAAHADLPAVIVR